MRNIKLTLEYDGSRYQGWQRPVQKGNSNTISGKLTETLQRMTGEELELFCGARTEAGVHAAGQTANFKTNCRLSVQEIQSSLNHYLPQDISVRSVQEVPERFHAALNARSQTYLYRIMTGPVPNVFYRSYAYYLPQMPDIRSMELAASALIGKHDFQCFSSGKKKNAAEKELLSIKISIETEAGFFMADETGNSISYGPELQILLTGNGFLHQMPRLITGTLLEIGCGKRTPGCIEHIFTGKESPSAPCPPNGLYLMEVTYP